MKEATMNKYEVQIRKGASIGIEKVEAKYYNWDEHSVAFYGTGRHAHASFDPRSVISVVCVQTAEADE